MSRFGFELAGAGAPPAQRLGPAGLVPAPPPAGAAPAAGPPLLLVPGGYHGAWCYRGYLGAFAAAGLAAAAVELRGHGALALEGLSPEAGIADYAADVAAAARRLGRPAVLVGHSLGALVAALAATLVPAAGLVLLAPSPPGNLPGAQALPAVPEGSLRPPPARAEIVARFFGGTAPPADALARIGALLCPESPAALNDRYLLRIAIDRGALAGLPALCLEAGREDAARHPEGQDRAVAAFYGAEYALLDQAPHCLMFGAAGEESAARILAWHRARFAAH